MTERINSAIDFYERHPISADIILGKLKMSRAAISKKAQAMQDNQTDQRFAGWNGALSPVERQFRSKPYATFSLKP